jgi:hypothetical protein
MASRVDFWGFYGDLHASRADSHQGLLPLASMLDRAGLREAADRAAQPGANCPPDGRHARERADSSGASTTATGARLGGR